MRDHLKESIAEQLTWGQRVDLEPVTKLLESKFIGIELEAFRKLYKQYASNSFSQQTKKDMGSGGIFRVAMRQFTDNPNLKDKIDRDTFMWIDLFVPEPRQALLDFILEQASTSWLMYGVVVKADIRENVANTTVQVSLQFDLPSYGVLRQFFESRLGKFLITKYNDVFLN